MVFVQVNLLHIFNSKSIESSDQVDFALTEHCADCCFSNSKVGLAGVERVPS